MPSMQRCVEVYKQATGKQIVNATQENKLGHSTGFSGMEEACTTLQIFVAAAKAAGPNLTNETFAKAIASLDKISLPAAPVASFGPNKPDGQDSFQLQKHDPSWKPVGGFRPLSGARSSSGVERLRAVHGGHGVTPERRATSVTRSSSVDCGNCPPLSTTSCPSGSPKTGSSVSSSNSGPPSAARRRLPPTGWSSQARMVLVRGHRLDGGVYACVGRRRESCCRGLLIAVLSE